jgi:hypothetical protein
MLIVLDPRLIQEVGDIVVEKLLRIPAIKILQIKYVNLLILHHFLEIYG